MSLKCSRAWPLPPALSKNHFPHRTEPSVRFSQRFSRRSHRAHFQPLESHEREQSEELAHQENIDMLKMNSASYWQHFPGFSPQDITAPHPEQGTIHPAPCLPPRRGQRLSVPPTWLFRKLAHYTKAKEAMSSRLPLAGQWLLNRVRTWRIPHARHFQSITHTWSN